MSHEADSIVADAAMRLRAHHLPIVREQVEKEYANALESANFLSRVGLRWRMRSEIKRRLNELAPEEALY